MLDHGRIIEQGTHDELLAAGGAYARLWYADGRTLTTSDRGADARPA